VAYLAVIKRMECPTSKHPMRHLWPMHHRLAILAVQQQAFFSYKQQLKFDE